VATLSERVEELTNDSRKLVDEIVKAEAEGKRLRQSKSELEDRYRHIGDEAARLNELLNQVKSWLTDYAELDHWQEEAANSKSECETMEKTIRGYAKTLEAMKDSRYQLNGDIREQKTQLKFLMTRPGNC